ncbi:MAG: tetratricopeptide repeat protein [Rhodospirillaceae bacterium]|nr:tetratricopeptide repeat protein [Rhodospirillaceae bacterium]
MTREDDTAKQPLLQDDMFKLAISHQHAGRFSEAEKIYNKILIEQSDDDTLLCNLGVSLRAQGKLKDAATSYGRAIKVNPGNWHAHVNLGNVLRDLGKLKESEVCYRHAIGINDQSDNTYGNLGDLLKEQGRLEEAALCFRAALTINHRHVDSAIALSAIENSTGNPEKARKILLKALRERPIITEKCSGRFLANVLLFVGVEDCGFELTEDFKHKMAGGHFSTTVLLPCNRFKKHLFHISGDNLTTHTENLPRHDLIVNTIACPDRERQSLLSVEKFLAAHPHKPLINHPEHVLKTTRDNNYKRLSTIKGITFPKTIRISTKGKQPEEIISTIRDGGFNTPIIIRRTGTQSAVSTEKINSFDDIGDYLARNEGSEFYVIQYIDCRFREDYYRKLRFFCIEGKLYPVVCHIDKVWNVHGNNRRTILKETDWMMAEEQKFLSDSRAYVGDENYRIFESFYDLIKLDFFGFDFNLLPDGSVLIYELNPAMRHSMDHAKGTPYLAPYLQKISDAFMAMAIKKAAVPK